MFKSNEKRRHVKSVKVLNQDPQTVIIGYPDGIELFSLELSPISMISLDRSKACCMYQDYKAKFIHVDKEDGLVAAVMKGKRSNQWYLYELDVDSLLILNQRPIVTNKSSQLRSGREITHLCSSEDCWFTTLKNGIYVLFFELFDLQSFEKNSKKTGRFYPSNYDSRNTYSIIVNNQWIQGYEDGSCLVKELDSPEVAYL